MFDEFSLFESTSFDDIMNDSYATESYNLFDDSYGYAFEELYKDEDIDIDESDATSDSKNTSNDSEKKKSGIWETIKKILAKFKEFVANFLQGIKNFLFGAKDEKGAVVKFGVAGYIGGLWKAAKADAEAKLRQEAAKSNESKFLAIESSDFSYAFEASDSKELEKTRREMAKAGVKAVNADMRMMELSNRAKEAGDMNIANFFEKVVSSVSHLTPNSADLPWTKEVKNAWNSVQNAAKAAYKTAEDTGKGANKEGDISKFKAFIGTLSRFFKYLGSMIQIMVLTKSTVKSTLKPMRNENDETRAAVGRLHKAVNNMSNGTNSEFLGNIAQEAYNAGYAHAMELYGNSNSNSDSYDLAYEDITSW